MAVNVCNLFSLLLLSL